MSNSILLFESWTKYDDKSLSQAQYYNMDKDIIGFPILDKSSDIMLLIEYVEFLPIALQTDAVLTISSNSNSESESIIHSIHGTESGSVAFISGPSTVSKLQSEPGGRARILELSILPGNKKRIALNYNLNRLMKCLGI